MASFVLAAGTGAYYRFSLIYPLPGVLEFVRHAHSHLMFFSWVTPALILLVGLALTRRGLNSRGFGLLALLAVVGGLATYLPFLKSGYHMASWWGSRPLPVSMLVSGANGAVWYALVALYLRATWREPRDRVLRLLDGAIALMVVSTVAVAGLAYLGASGQVQRVLMLALVDWFLTVFADGWFGLAILALAAFHVSAARLARFPLGLLVWVLVAAMSVRSVARFGTNGLALGWTSGVDAAASATAALIWLALVSALWRTGTVDELAGTPEAGTPLPRGATLLLRQLALLLLAVKGVVELVGAVPAAHAWVFQQPLHIFFLHAFLLGAVSLSLIAAMRVALGAGAFQGAVAFTVAVAVMVAALLPFTPLWPRALAGAWALHAAAYTSLGPLLVAIWALLRLKLASAATTTRRSRAEATSEPITP